MSHRQKFGAIILLGAVLRLAFLGHQPLWRDEAFNALAIDKPFGEMLRVIGNDSAPPLVYIIQHVIASFWFTPTSIRLVSAFGGIAAIPIAAAIGRRIGGEKIELWTAFTVAIFPSAVLTSRDARMYSVAMTLSLAAVLTLWRFTEKRSAGRWLAFTAACIACVYSDYFTGFAICGALAAALIWLRPSWRTLFEAGIGAALSVATLIPWFIHAQGQLSHASDQFWVNPIGILTLSGVAIQFVAGPPTDDAVPFDGLQRIVQTVSLFGGVAAFAGLFWGRKRLADASRRAVAFVVSCGLLSIGLLILISLWHPLVEARYASAMWGTLICAAGVGLGLLNRHKIRLFAVGALLVCSVTLIALYRVPDTPVLLQNLPKLGPHDFVEASPPAYLLLDYYGSPEVMAHTRVVAPDGVAWYWGTAVYPPNAVVKSVPADVVANGGTLYLIDIPAYYEGVFPPGYHQSGKQSCFSTLCITRFVPK